MKKISVLCLCAGVLSFSACKEIDTSTLTENQGAYVLNEGSDNSTISYYNFEKESIQNNYFQKNNGGQSLGQNVRSMAIRRSTSYPDGKGYVVVEGSNGDGHIEVIDMKTFKSIKQIDGISYPGDIVLVSETKGYVTSGNGTGTDSDVIIELDLVNDTKGRSLKVGMAPAKVVTSGKYLYVANKGTGAVADNRIIVKDLSNDAVSVDTLEVGYAPIDMAVDKYGNVWVYCNGTANNNDQALVKLEKDFNVDNGPLTHAIYTLPFSERADHGDNCLTASRLGSELFYVHGITYRLGVDVDLISDEELATNTQLTNEEKDTNKNALPTEGCISGEYADKTFNGIDIDPRTGRLNALLAGSDNKLVLFSIRSSKVELVSEGSVGVKPFATVFNY